MGLPVAKKFILDTPAAGRLRIPPENPSLSGGRGKMRSAYDRYARHRDSTFPLPGPIVDAGRPRSGGHVRTRVERTLGQAKRLVVGMSGASGAVLAQRFLRQMAGQAGWETHLVISPGAERTIELELGEPVSAVAALADVVHDAADIGASIASGTFRTEGMVVIPCSMKSLAGIAHGYTDNLLLRAADVTLKEQRKLVLVARETPLGRIHLRNMAMLADQGVRILPPMLTFYTRPRTIDDLVDHVLGKVLGEFGIEGRNFHRWGETGSDAAG